MRNQNESYAKALAFHKAKFQYDKENMERFMKWKIALEQAAELSGYDFNFGYPSSFTFILCSYVYFLSSISIDKLFYS
jgi:hypothetical protein